MILPTEISTISVTSVIAPAHIPPKPFSAQSTVPYTRTYCPGTIPRSRLSH